MRYFVDQQLDFWNYAGNAATYTGTFLFPLIRPNPMIWFAHGGGFIQAQWAILHHGRFE